MSMKKDSSSVRKVWALLDNVERRGAALVLLVLLLGAIASATMVASVFPFLSVLANPDVINENKLLRWAFEVGNFNTRFGFVTALGLGTIGLVILSNLVLIAQTWILSSYTQMRVHSFSRRLLTYYVAQPYEFFLGRHSDEMAVNLLAETQQVVAQYLRPMAELIASALTVVAVLVTIFVVNPNVASILLFTVGTIYGGVTIACRSYLGQLGRTRAQSNEKRFRVAGEALSGIKDVKLLGLEAAYLDRFSEPSAKMTSAVARVAVVAQIPRYVIQMVAFGSVIALCLVLLDPAGVNESNALENILPLLGVLAFAAQKLIPELQKVHYSVTKMTAGAAALDRVYDDLAVGEYNLDRTQHKALGLRRTLALENIRFTYPEANRPSLSGVSFTARAGERIGVVGASGAGKTTIADVILGLLLPQAGSIYADGIEVTENNLRAWQRTVGYVPQDIFLTDASLLENIAFGLPTQAIDADKVERSSRTAQIHEFIMTELPDGYETYVGERGVRLSGGQRQRIGIARALYHNADLIVFDEATSALDNLTEREVMGAIEALPGDKTIIMIAHRLSTVRSCDKIILLKNGQVAAVGDWDTLICDSEEFRRMANNENFA